MKNISIKTPSIFSFKECLKFLNRSADERLFFVEKERIRKLFFLESQPIFSELYLENGKELKLSFLNKNPSESQVQIIKEYYENWLDLQSDLQQFYKMAAEDKLLRPLIKKYYGLRLIGIPDFYEAICWAIIGQQINLKFAYSVKKSLVERFGSKFEFEGKLYYDFPDPATMLSIKNETFAEMKFSRQKVTYIRAISNDLLNQTVDIETFRNLDYSAAKKELIGLHGIGNWSADYILMKTFRHPQAFPIQDAGLQNALKKQLGLNKKPDLSSILQLSNQWKGFEAYATFYLWRSLND